VGGRSLGNQKSPWTVLPLDPAKRADASEFDPDARVLGTNGEIVRRTLEGIGPRRKEHAPAAAPDGLGNRALNRWPIVGRVVALRAPVLYVDNITKPLRHRPSGRGSSCRKTEVCKSRIGLRRARRP